jgi:methylglutaconyl-CoA hydratase
VVGPPIERKIGVSAFSQLAINATNWYSADWAREKGLYTSIHDTVDEMDSAIDVLVEKLSNSNPEAMALLKRVFWEGTEHWDELLSERAELSGNLVLSDFTRNAIAKFKKGER